MLSAASDEHIGLIKIGRHGSARALKLKQLESDAILIASIVPTPALQPKQPGADAASHCSQHPALNSAQSRNKEWHLPTDSALHRSETALLFIDYWNIAFATVSHIPLMRVFVKSLSYLMVLLSA
jgi:hypothetical protein